MKNPPVSQASHWYIQEEAFNICVSVIGYKPKNWFVSYQRGLKPKPQPPRCVSISDCQTTPPSREEVGCYFPNTPDTSGSDFQMLDSSSSSWLLAAVRWTWPTARTPVEGLRGCGR